MNEQFKEWANEINDIYALISTLYVSGDAIDTVAAVRFRLQKLYKEVSENANS